MAWLYWPHCIVSVNEIVILMGCILLALFLISCLYKIYVSLDAQIRARPCFLKKKAKTKSFIICVFTIHWIKDIDCSSSRFRESTSIKIPNGFSTFYDSWTTKMLDRRVSFPPLPVQIQLVYGQTSFDFSCIWVYVRVCTQVCTRAVVTQIHKGKHQAGALIGVPQLWLLLQLN